MITEDRLHHMIGVARQAYKTALRLGYDEKFARRCFALGWNHDIGYEFDSETHEQISSNMLESFDYNSAIRDHGSIPKHINIEWLILNYADMTTSPTGETVTIDKRLNEIESRYGKDHEWYKKAFKVCECLKANF